MGQGLREKRAQHPRQHGSDKDLPAIERPGPQHRNDRPRQHGMADGITEQAQPSQQQIAAEDGTRRIAQDSGGNGPERQNMVWRECKRSE